MPVLEGARLDEAKEILGRYPEGRERSSIMPLLYLVQSVEGFVSRDGLTEVAELLGLTTAEVEAVATFYTMYRHGPTGTHVVNVCTNLACMLRGAYELIEHCEGKLGVHCGHTTQDGKITLEFAECIGACDGAPACLVNDVHAMNVTPEKADALITELKLK